MFKLLPKGVQESVCLCLSDQEFFNFFTDRDPNKIETGIFEPNDYFWELKLSKIGLKQLSDEKLSARERYCQVLNDSGFFIENNMQDVYLSLKLWKQKDDNHSLAFKMLKDENFLQNHINCKSRDGWSLL
jgi:hypothetical protein